MCMYDTSKQEVKEKCQTVGKLQESLSKEGEDDADELIKCGACYDESNIYSRIDDASECTIRNAYCKEGDNDEDHEYPICIWDVSKEEKKDRCEKLSKIVEYLADGGVDGDILLDCGSCDDLNLFEPYWEPSLLL